MSRGLFYDCLAGVLRGVLPTERVLYGKQRLSSITCEGGQRPDSSCPARCRRGSPTHEDRSRLASRYRCPFERAFRMLRERCRPSVRALQSSGSLQVGWFSGCTFRLRASRGGPRDCAPRTWGISTRSTEARKCECECGIRTQCHRPARPDPVSHYREGMHQCFPIAPMAVCDRSTCLPRSSAYPSEWARIGIFCPARDGL